MYAHVPCSEDVFCRDAYDLFETGDGRYDLIPSEPQILPGISSLVAVPTWMRGSDKTVVVFDFSHWGGPVYAVADWTFFSIHSCAADARRYAPESWQVHAGNSEVPLQEDQAVIATPGLVFRFMPRGHSLTPRVTLKEALSHEHGWNDKPSYIPREAFEHKWLAMRSHVHRTPVYGGTSYDELCAISAEAFQNEAAELHFIMPESRSPLQQLVYQGSLMRGIIAAEPRIAETCRSLALIFVDPRALGRSPFFHVCPPGKLALGVLADYIGFKIPAGFMLQASGVSSNTAEVCVEDRCTVSLFLVAAQEGATTASAVESRSTLATFGLSAVTGTLGPDQEIAGPRRRDRERDPEPDPETALGTAPVIDDPDEEDIVTATFLVVAPRFQCEHIQLQMHLPATVDHVLGIIADLSNANFSLHFTQLVPALSQPDVSFGAILAVPEWASDCACVLIDARSVDNRFFAQAFPLRLNRSSILLHLCIPADKAVRIFSCGQELLDGPWYNFSHGDTLVVLPEGAIPGPVVHLEDMLRGAYDWVSPCPSYGGPHFPAFCVLSDGGHKVILVDVDTVTSSADFKRIAISELQYTSEHALVSSSVPRVGDLEVTGQYCKAILVATEYVVRLPIPPGRLSLLRTIVFIDRRCLLQDFTWVVAERGLIDRDWFLEPYQNEAPAGYSVNVKGADTEIYRGRPCLRTPNGTLLTLTYVDSDSSTSDCPPSSESSDDPPSHTACRDDGLSEGTGSRPPSPAPSGRGGEPGHTEGDRSRSPRRRSASVAGNSPPTEQGPRDSSDEVTSGCISVKTKASPFLQLGQGPCPVCQHWVNSWLEQAVTHLFVKRAPAAFDVGILKSLAETDCFGLTLKTLGEPHLSTQALRESIAFLRYAAPRLGRAWRYRPPEDAIHITPDSDTDTAEGSDDGPTTLHFVVLKPGFTPEHFRLQLQLPATLNEALRELQALRPPAEVRKFSSLIPANPQPCPGNGVVLALPAWCTGPDHPRVFLCLDTSLVDGRLYTCASPPYISRRHLLHLACLPLDSGVDVHIGDDPVPLDHEGQHQVINGDTFVFAPAGTIVPTLHSLALDLFNRQEWSPISTFPRVSSDGHYGLVHESESILYTTQFEQPTAFRERIAACVGVRIGNLKVSPSSPRIADAALDGYPCRTVIAICDSSAGAGLPLFGVLVDCRAILRGWQAFEVIAERVSCIRVLVVLQRIAPPGWRIYLEGVPADADWIAVRPGQVLIAALAPAMPLGFPEQVPEDSAQAPEAGSSHEGVGLAGEPDSGAPVPISSDPGSEQDDPEHSGQSDIHGSHPRVTGQGEHVACRFLLLGPGYIAELVEVRLPVGSPVATAVARVAAARAPQDVLRLPRVFAVDPQPHGSHALCVTAPEWDVHGAIVVFDSRGINGKLFAFQITCPIDRAGLLTVAQFETSDPVDVFIGSQPWPLVDGPLVSLVHGDLVLLRSAQAPAHTIVSLHDMLLAAAGWDSAFDPAQQIEGGFSGHTWLLGDERSELFIVRPERHRQIRQDIAAAFGVSSRELVLQPARLHTPDFAHKGTAVNTVLAALSHTGFLPSTRSRPTVCFVDARPVLHTITWKVCPDGVLDTTELFDRFIRYCPAGYSVWIFRNDLSSLPAGVFVPVADGEVLTVMYRPFQVDQTEPPSPPDSPDDGDSDGDRPDEGDEQPGLRYTSVQDAPSQRPADTGGTVHTDRGPQDFTNAYFAVMWYAILLHLADLAGKWWPTPVGCRFGSHRERTALCSRHALCSRLEWSRGVPTLCAYPLCLPATADKCALVSCDQAGGPRRQGDTPVTFPGLIDTRDVQPFGQGFSSSGHQGQPAPFTRDKEQCARRTFSGRSWPGSAASPPCYTCTFHRPFRSLLVFLLTWSATVQPCLAGRPDILACYEESPAAETCRDGHPIGRSTRRPIATPARAPRSFGVPGVASTELSDLDAPDSLVTLLEQSVLDPACNAFFLASTLLETLHEHFQEKASQAPSLPPEAPLLRLADHLPSQIEHDVSRVVLASPLNLEHVSAVLACVWRLPRHLDPGLNLHYTLRLQPSCPIVSGLLQVRLALPPFLCLQMALSMV